MAQDKECTIKLVPDPDGYLWLIYLQTSHMKTNVENIHTPYLWIVHIVLAMIHEHLISVMQISDPLSSTTLYVHSTE